jgi:Stress responsive A/B Barrel Domain
VNELGCRKTLVHHVLFWLKNPKSEQDLAALLSGLNTLRQIPAIREIHIGVPAATELREVIDSSYSVSELMLFDDVAAQNEYQNHPVHKQFVENCSHLWERVVVYDSMDIQTG